EKIGSHKGYPFYTIGQRKGLDIAFGKPMYVTQIIPETNTVVLGEIHELQQSRMLVSGINWVKYAGISDGMEAITKIRYKDPGTESILQSTEEGIQVSFHHSVNSIAPGQSAVFYEGDDVIAGGIIRKGF